MGFWFSPPVRAPRAQTISPLPHTPFTTLALLQTSLLPSRSGSARSSFDSVSSVSSASSVTSEVRAQGVLVLTYALRTVRGADSEKLQVVRELEGALGDVEEGAYRDRVYRLGGKLERCVDLEEVGGML